MKTATILIGKELDEQIETALQNHSILAILKKKGGRKNSGKGELIRRALRTGLPIELQKLTRQSAKLVQE